MKVGITYDLREDYLAEGFSLEETAEFDKPDTIDAIESALCSLGHETERIGHVRSLVARLAEGSRWDLVFNIAEGMRGYGREAQVPALLDAYGIPYTFSDPLVLTLTLHKGMTKRVVRDLGIPTPGFAVVDTETDVKDIDLPYPLFAKPVAEGTGKGVSGASKAEDADGLMNVCRELLSRFRQPVLVETYLPGREFTVGIVGAGPGAYSLGAMEVHLGKDAEAGAYSYTNKENYEQLVTYALADDAMARKAEEVALAAWRGLGCVDGGRVDLRADERGVPNFIEVNPLAGLNPKHSDLPIMCRMKGITFDELIGRIMEAAIERISLTPNPLSRRARGISD